jgi:hypothetical protein
VAMALKAQPGNTKLAKAAAEIGISSVAGLEEAARAAHFLSPDNWHARMQLLAARVCRIERTETNGGTRFGTGFLVAPDLVLTANHVVGAPEESAGSIFCRFDYVTTHSGDLIAEGTSVRVACHGVLATGHCGDTDNMGYALLRLADPLGLQSAGGRAGESPTPLRGWIMMPETYSPTPVGDVLYMLHHTEGGPLRISVGKFSGRSEGSLCFYDIHAASGSSGAPCLSSQLEPIAIHLGARAANGEPLRSEGFGLLLKDVLSKLSAQGLGHLVKIRLE